MALIRILDRGGLFRQTAEGEPDLENMCGSAAKHFKVSPKGKLSFYKDDTVPVERIALGFALSRERVDDVEFARLPEGVVAGIVKLEQCMGTTKLKDVNEQHVDALDVSMARLGRLVVAAKAAGEQDSMSGEQVAATILEQLDVGQLTEKDVGEKLVESLKKTNAYKNALLRKAAG
ncbi:MAG TPA: hypothetical protein VGD21_09165 [Lysobacter sp.]